MPGRFRQSIRIRHYGAAKVIQVSYPFDFLLGTKAMYLPIRRPGKQVTTQCAGLHSDGVTRNMDGGIELGLMPLDNQPLTSRSFRLDSRRNRCAETEHN